MWMAKSNLCCHLLHHTASTKSLSKLRNTMTTTSSSVTQNNNMQLVDDTPFANIADPPTDVDFLGKSQRNGNTD